MTSSVLLKAARVYSRRAPLPCLIRCSKARAMSTPSRIPVPSLISCADLRSKFNTAKVLDGSYHMPYSGRDPAKEFLEIGHIAGAHFFDIEVIKDKDTHLPHMMPPASQFARQVGELGIRNEDHVVVYDTVGLFSSPRVYWMFKAFGHEKVSVLNGGFKAWKHAGYPIETGQPSSVIEIYSPPVLNKSLIKDYSQILTVVNQPSCNPSTTVIIDSRRHSRFTGQDPEHDLSQSSGHIPGAKNLPYRHIFEPETGLLMEQDKLLEVFEQVARVNVQSIVAMVNSNQGEVILSCGTGVSACIVYFALERLGVKSRMAVYDGSWAEYASRPESIIIKAKE